MRKIVSLLLLTAVLLLTLNSCSVITNAITVLPLRLEEQDGEACFFSGGWKYRLDLENLTYEKVERSTDLSDQELLESKNAFVFKSFHGSYNESEYEALNLHLENCEMEAEDSIVYAFGYWNEAVLTGFVQVYSHSGRSCSGYDIDNVDHSLLFTYDATTDAFTVLETLEGVVVVALSQNTVIYWKGINYYAYDLDTKEEVFLGEDRAYDKGMKNHSSPVIYYNGELCVLHLVKEYNKECIYIYNFETKAFLELTFQVPAE